MTAAGPRTAESSAPDEPTAERRPARRWLRALAITYVTLLVASWTWRAMSDAPIPGEDTRPMLSLRAVEVEQGEPPVVRRTGQAVELSYREWGDRADPTIVLLHGSPGRKDNFSRLAPYLGEQLHVVVPDLPGFGESTLDIPDYSIVAHADYVLQMLDELDIESAHFVGYSMGGGPALHVWERAPERVASLTMLASIGVQELELLGDRDLNHAVHGLQLLAALGLAELIPHFGLTDRFARAVTYARNFFDTDQRPLRELLRRFEPPMLVIHGSEDFLVPPEAAVEHHRIVPHSELWMWEGEDHFMVFRSERQEALSGRILDFVERVEQGEAHRRADAGAARIARSEQPFDPGVVPPATGAWLVVLMVLIALATLVSEDLTCIGAGLMASQGRIDFLPAAAA